MEPSNGTEKRMTLEEARKVRWHSRNPRPMGELLDEGYLTRKDLLWAVDKAFDWRQKQAALTLLTELERDPKPQPQTPQRVALPPELASSPYSVGLTMEQIRVTEWPFSPYKGHPMGILADKQQLTLKDLGYAAESAWEQRVRQAAVALMLVRLNQVLTEPPSPTGLLNVVSGGRSFSERRQIELVFAEAALLGTSSGVILTLLFLLAIRILSTPAKPVSPTSTSPIVIVVALIILAIPVGVLWLVSKLLDVISDRITKQIRFHRKGEEGEERVVAAMHAVLDGNWFLFRNIVLPGRNKGDLDSVLVGPTGVWVVEIKNFSGEYRNTGEVWEYRAKNRWQPARKSPSRQASENARRLYYFLQADNIQQKINSAVVWANPEAQLQVENPAVAVWKLDHLPDELDNICQDKPMPDGKRQQIVDKLTKLCEAQRQEALKKG